MASSAARGNTVNEVVVSYGEALIDDDPARIGTVTALGLDEAAKNA